MNTKTNATRRTAARLAFDIAALTLTVSVLGGAPATAAAGAAAGSSASTSAQSSAASAFPAEVDNIAVCGPEKVEDTWTPEKNRQLSDAFNNDDWSGVETQITGLLKAFKCTPIAGQIKRPSERRTKNPDTTAGDLPNLTSFVGPHPYFSVLFLDETLPVPTLQRVVVHKYHQVWRAVDPKDSDLPEVYGSRIGDFELYELRLLPAGVLAISQYNGSSSPNTLITQVPSVLGQVAAGLKGAIPAGVPPLPPAGMLLAAETNVAACGTDEIHPPTIQPTMYLMRHISVPDAFEPHFPKIPSVTPAVAISDQMTLSPELEIYMLDSQKARAASTPISTYLQLLEERLFASYVTCRSLVGIDVDAQASKDNANLVAKVRYPATSAAFSSQLRVRFTVTPKGGAAVVLPPQNLQTGGFNCAPASSSSLPNGQYEVSAELLENGRSAVLATARTIFFVTSPGQQVKGSLTMDSRSGVWGSVPLKASYTVEGASPNTPLQLRVVDSKSGDDRGAVQLPKVAQPAGGAAGAPTKGDASLETVAAGVGDRVAVLEAYLSGVWIPLAQVRFTVTDVLAAGQTAAPTPPSGAACLGIDNPDLLTAVDNAPDLASRFTDLFSAYSGLITLASPSPSASTPLATQYTLGKLTKWAFSLGVGATWGRAFNKPSPELADPLAWVALDWRPWRYDETRFSPTFAERARAFFGIALTPDVGFVTGIGIGIVRGLTLEAGVGVLLGTSLADNQTPCTTTPQMTCPAPRTVRKPLGLGFLGLGYSMQ